MRVNSLVGRSHFGQSVKVFANRPGAFRDDQRRFRFGQIEFLAGRRHPPVVHPERAAQGTKSSAGIQAASPEPDTGTPCRLSVTLFPANAVEVLLATEEHALAVEDGRAVRQDLLG